MTDDTPPPSGDTGASATPAPATTTPAVDTPAPNAVSQASQSSGDSSMVASTPPAAPDSPAPFKLPEAYKDKPWAAKIKSEDDLFKQLDHLNSAVGKKIVVPDLTKATDAEREEYYAQLRPPSTDAYEFSEETDPAIKTVISESLLKNGISSVQANAIIKDYQAAEQALLAEQYKPEVIEQSMKAQFGDDWKQVTGQTRAALKGMMTAEDFDLVDNLPNTYMAIIYRTLGNVVQKFGVKETDSHVNGAPGGQVPPDMSALRQGIRNEIAALVHKPHTAAQKQALIDKLNATYQPKA